MEDNLHIFAVDWGKDVAKRAAYRADLAGRTIQKLHFDGSLLHLVRLANQSSGPVVIGIDAALGYPAVNWQALQTNLGVLLSDFSDLLFHEALPDDFFAGVSRPEQWRPDQPFISPPAGKWSRDAFNQQSNNGLMRPIDVQLSSNPMFITSGMPGTVGSGTRALWMALRDLHKQHDFRLWPFAGPLVDLLSIDTPVIGEMYPKACYGIALSDRLPSALLTIGKTNAAQRATGMNKLLSAQWLKHYGVKIFDIEQARGNEDDFDALISAVALLRLALEGASFESQSLDNIKIEGGILGAINLTGLDKKGRFKSKSLQSDPAIAVTAKPSKPVQHNAQAKPIVSKAAVKKPVSSKSSGKQYQCPIPGCDKVFHGSRGGWDSHVEWLKRHPDWYPEITDRHERKALFRSVFAEWFA